MTFSQHRNTVVVSGAITSNPLPQHQPNRAAITSTPLNNQTMKPQPIENLLSSHNRVCIAVAQSIHQMQFWTTLISFQVNPATLGLFSRELGVPCDIEDIGDNMSKYSIDLEIRGEVCKVWAVGESISK